MDKWVLFYCLSTCRGQAYYPPQRIHADVKHCGWKYDSNPITKALNCTLIVYTCWLWWMAVWWLMFKVGLMKWSYCLIVITSLINLEAGWQSPSVFVARCYFWTFTKIRPIYISSTRLWPTPVQAIIMQEKNNFLIWYKTIFHVTVSFHPPLMDVFGEINIDDIWSWGISCSLLSPFSWRCCG